MHNLLGSRISAAHLFTAALLLSCPGIIQHDLFFLEKRVNLRIPELRGKASNLVSFSHFVLVRILVPSQ
jgi:hypothetical protein